MRGLDKATPFMANVQGVLGEVGGVSFAQSGAHNAALEENNEVILYFAVGTSPTAPEMPGVLWLYDSSHVMLLRQGCSIPPRRTHMTLRT